MDNFFSNNDDILFHFNKRIPWGELFTYLGPEELETFGVDTAAAWQESLNDILASFGEICGGTIANNAVAVDLAKHEFVDGQDVRPKELEENRTCLLDFGFAAMGIDQQFGGMGVPIVLDMVGAEILNRACPSTALMMAWYSSIARVLENFGSAELKQKYLPKIASGEYSGNMALTEADAGSDLGAIRTYGERNGDHWKLYGTKRFISNGTSELSLVLARGSKGGQGLQDLNLYLCPRMHEGKENIKVLRLEDKVGLHGSATAELAYEGAVAWLIGEEKQGFKYMLQLMNDSRLSVGCQGVGLMEATWRIAHDYAQQRKSWGKLIAEHELIAELLLDLEVELKAGRSLCYQTAILRSQAYGIGKQLQRAGLSSSERQRLLALQKSYNAQVRRYTPLIKYWAGERSYWHARQALQVLGGYGFTTEFRAEWWVRESLIYSLYEGTSQIQALMCMKDSLKEVLSRPQALANSLFWHRVNSHRGDPLQRSLNSLRLLSDQALVRVLAKLFKVNKVSMSALRGAWLPDNLSPALLHAERFCELKLLIAFGESLLADAECSSERHYIAQRFLHKALPRGRYLFDLIRGEDRVLYQQGAEVAAS